MSNETSIVVVDDEPSIRELLVASLHFAGYEVETAASGSEAIEIIEKTQPDLIILDVMLPDIDGFTVTRRIRQEGIDAPVLFLTARDDTQDKVMGLTVGGDDYVTKPFSLEEVVARIRAILRRTREQEQDDPIIRVGDLEINEDSHDVTRAGKPIELSPTEYKLCATSWTTRAACCRRRRSSTMCGNTTGAATPPSSNRTSRICARRSTTSRWRTRTARRTRCSR